jgi:putative colanic acid biosynthesis glycosyltransferase
MMLQTEDNSPSFLFSIITVTLNNFDGLLKTKLSIDTQIHESFEWLVLDGGSKDRSVEYLRSIKDMKNFRYVSESDKGIYDAMNKGITLARGHYLIFLNAGDTFTDGNVLKTMSNLIVDPVNSADLYYGDSWETNAEGKRYFRKARKARFWLSLGPVAHHQAMFFKREAIKSGFNVDYKIAADYALFAMLFKSNRSIEKVEFAICDYLRGGVSERSLKRIRAEEWRIRKTILGLHLTANLIIYLTRYILSSIKLLFPRLYGLIRYDKKAS